MTIKQTVLAILLDTVFMKRHLAAILFGLLCATTNYAKDLKVFQINIWQETTMVKGAFNGLVNEIVNINPDVILLSEVRNYEGNPFVPRLLKALRQKGKDYNGQTTTGVDVSVLSKYKILEQKSISGAGSVLKARLDVDGRTVIVYSAHLDYTHYACYLPRGYNGVTWDKMESPITDSGTIEKANNESMRDEAIADVIEDIKTEKGNFILLGGDFNEPSHLDWGEKVKNLWDHRGAVVKWDCSVMLENAGFKDSYRVKYPNPVTHPGFTYPADNPDATLKQLDWVPEADGRDRIDFIYYLPAKGVKLKEAFVVGPRSTIANNKRANEDTKDNFIEPHGIWPTDHKGVLAIFKMK